MVELDFTIEDARFDPASLSPLMLFQLRLANRTPAVAVQNVALQCQVRIEPTRRRYGAGEADRLLDLFGETERWGKTLQSFLWANATLSAPAFEAERRIELPVPCSFDFNIAATKYFHGLEDGAAPLSFLFSGSVFYRREDGRLQIGQVPWSKTASYRLPVAVWQAMMDHHYPDCAFLQLDREVFERLYAFRRRRGLASFGQAIEALLAGHAAETLQ